MCRLFGLSGGSHPLRATFWLLEAPDSLAHQSRSNPDGYGIATFAPDGTARVDKRPAEADEDEEFAQEAKELQSTTFVAHVRYASTGAVKLQNTHPFEQHGRVLAHNGHIGELPKLESQLGDYLDLVHGDTDSERFFALITREIDTADGDIEAGIASAVRWVASELPVFSLNFVLATATELWGFRYPDTHPLMVLERRSGGHTGRRHLDAASPAGTVRVRSAALCARAAVIVATERMDEDARWQMLDPGALVRIDRELQVSTRVVVDFPPRRPIRLADLEPQAARSQEDYQTQPA